MNRNVQVIILVNEAMTCLITAFADKPPLVTLPQLLKGRAWLNEAIAVLKPKPKRKRKGKR